MNFIGAGDVCIGGQSGHKMGRDQYRQLGLQFGWEMMKDLIIFESSPVLIQNPYISLEQLG